MAAILAGILGAFWWYSSQGEGKKNTVYASFVPSLLMAAPGAPAATVNEAHGRSVAFP
jgi:hypothetical protein